METLENMHPDMNDGETEEDKEIGLTSNWWILLRKPHNLVDAVYRCRAQREAKEVRPVAESTGTASDDEGATPFPCTNLLHSYCDHKKVCLDVIQTLISANPSWASQRDEDGFLPIDHYVLNRALYDRDITKALIEANTLGPDKRMRPVSEGSSALQRLYEPTLHIHLAAAFCCKVVLELLIADDPEAVKIPTKFGYYPLHMYIYKGKSVHAFAKTEVIQLLLRADPQSARRVFNKAFPLHAYLDKNANAAPSVVRLLCDNKRGGFEDAVRLQGTHDALPLTLYICHNVKNPRLNSDVVRVLLELNRPAAEISAQKDVNIAMDIFDQKTSMLKRVPKVRQNLPLHWACLNERADLRVIELLLRAFPQAARIESNMEDLPIHCHLYTRSASEKIVRLLLRYFPESAKAQNASGDLPLHCYIKADIHTASTRQISMIEKDMAKEDAAGSKKGRGRPRTMLPPLHANSISKTLGAPEKWQLFSELGKSAVVYKQPSIHSEELRMVKDHSELHFNHGCTERVIPGLKDHVFKQRQSELKAEYEKEEIHLKQKMESIHQNSLSMTTNIDVLREEIEAEMQQLQKEYEFNMSEIEEGQKRRWIQLASGEGWVFSGHVFSRETHWNGKVNTKHYQEWKKVDNRKARDRASSFAALIKSNTAKISPEEDGGGGTDIRRSQSLVALVSTAFGDRARQLEHDHRMTEESEIHEDVVLALIEAYPESCTMRCMRKEKKEEGKKGRRGNFKLDGFNARKASEHKRGKLSSSLVSTAFETKEGARPIDLYLQKLADHKAQPGVFSLLLGSIEMHEVYSTIDRPNSFEELARFSLAPTADRYSLEAWVASFIEKGLHEDDLALLDKEYNVDEETSESLHHVEVAVRARSSFILNAIPVSSPAQYALTSSEGLELQARLFEAMHEHVLALDSKGMKKTLRRKHVADILIEYLVELIMDATWVESLEESRPEQASIEAFVSSWVVQVVIGFAFNKLGPSLLYNLELSVFLVLGYLYTQLVYDFTGTESVGDDRFNKEFLPRVLIATVISTSFLARECLLMRRMRKVELSNMHTSHSDEFDWGKPLVERAKLGGFVWFGFPTAWRNNPWKMTNLCINAFVLRMFITMFLQHGDLTNSKERWFSVVAVILQWLQFIIYLSTFNQSLSTYILMVAIIAKNAKYFLLLLLVILLGFGHAFFIAFRNEDFTSNANDVLNPWKTAVEAMSTVVFMALGLRTFEETFPEADSNDEGGDHLSTRLYVSLMAFFVFSIMISIIMLNLLIAVVTDSYDDAITRSAMLFWYSRLLMVAEYGTLLKPGGWSSGGGYPDWFVLGKAECKQAVTDHCNFHLGATSRYAGKIMDIFSRISRDGEYKTKRMMSQLKGHGERLEDVIDAREKRLDEKLNDVHGILAELKELKELMKRQLEANSTIGSGGSGSGSGRGTTVAKEPRQHDDLSSLRNTHGGTAVDGVAMRAFTE